MRAHNPWQIEFKRDIPVQMFSLFLKAVRKALVDLACPIQKQGKQFLFSTQRRSVLSGTCRAWAKLPAKHCQNFLTEISKEGGEKAQMLFSTRTRLFPSNMCESHRKLL